MDTAAREDLLGGAKILRQESEEWAADKSRELMRQSPVQITIRMHMADVSGAGRAWSEIAKWKREFEGGASSKTSLINRAKCLAERWEREAMTPPGGPLTKDEKRRIEAIQNEAPLDLELGLHERLKALEPEILRVFSTGDIVLGGGTVLIARYGHRDSFDLDLFYERLEWMALYERHGDNLWREALGEYWEADWDIEGRIPQAGIASIGGIETTVCALTGVGLEAGYQPITGCRLKAQSTRNIVEGKIEGRLLDPEIENTIRDLYDITVVARLEPNALKEVLEKAYKWPGWKEEAERSLASTPRDLHETDPRPIVNPRYGIELEGLAAQLVPLFRSGDPLDAPDATPTQPDPKQQSAGPER